MLRCAKNIESLGDRRHHININEPVRALPNSLPPEEYLWKTLHHLSRYALLPPDQHVAARCGWSHVGRGNIAITRLEHFSSRRLKSGLACFCNSLGSEVSRKNNKTAGLRNAGSARGLSGEDCQTRSHPRLSEGNISKIAIILYSCNILLK